MDFLDFIPTYIFEIIGTVAGMSACGVLVVQIIKEYKIATPSSLSMTFVMGWFFIYLFWLLYGIRFDSIALGLSNGIAVVLQVILWVRVKYKSKI